MGRDTLERTSRMSILAAADPEGSALGMALAIFAGVAAVAVAALTGVLRLPPAALSPRVPPARPLLPLGAVLFLGVLMWVGLPSLYLQWVGGGADGVESVPMPPAPPTAVPPTTAPVTYGLSPRHIVSINAAVPVLAFIVLALGDAVVRPVVGQRLGFAMFRLPRGVVWGGVGILLALPLVFCVMALTAWIYQEVGYHPPGEHELLRTMDDTRDSFVKYLAIVVAVAVAPLWEELLFRGHVQTLIREGLARLRQSGTALESAGGLPAIGATLEPPSSGSVVRGRALPLEYEVPPLTTPAQPRRAFALEPWLAIGITSLLFAGVHQPWQFPPIFCLSLCLGLAYERTGNLWAPVVMHALFNGVMTAIYLSRGAATV